MKIEQGIEDMIIELMKPELYTNQHFAGGVEEVYATPVRKELKRFDVWLEVSRPFISESELRQYESEMNRLKASLAYFEAYKHLFKEDPLIY